LDLFIKRSEDDFNALLAEVEKEISMVDIMKELGYRFTFDVSLCKEILSLFLPPTKLIVSKILGTIAHTYAGLFKIFWAALGSGGIFDIPMLNSWNIDVLVDSIKLLVCSIFLSF